MEFIKGVIIVPAMLMSISSLLSRSRSHHEAAEIITLSVFGLMAALEWLGVLSAVAAADIALLPCTMYLWGRATEYLSLSHRYFWLGYFLGIVGPVYVKVKSV